MNSHSPPSGERKLVSHAGPSAWLAEYGQAIDVDAMAMGAIEKVDGCLKLGGGSRPAFHRKPTLEIQ